MILNQKGKELTETEYRDKLKTILTELLEDYEENEEYEVCAAIKYHLLNINQLSKEKLQKTTTLISVLMSIKNLD